MDPFWHQNRAKIGPRRVLRPYSFEHVDSHETSAGVVFEELLGPQDGAKIDPRSAQDSLKTDLKRDRFLRFFWSIFGRLGLRLGPLLGHLGVSGCRLGVIWAPSWAPKTVQKSTQVAHQKLVSLPLRYVRARYIYYRHTLLSPHELNDLPI